jgi:hypothetical protein
VGREDEAACKLLRIEPAMGAVVNGRSIAIRGTVPEARFGRFRYVWFDGVPTLATEGGHFRCVRVFAQEGVQRVSVRLATREHVDLQFTYCVVLRPDAAYLERAAGVRRRLASADEGEQWTGLHLAELLPDFSYAPYLLRIVADGRTGTSEPHASQRWAAISALGTIRYLDAVPTLIDLLSSRRLGTAANQALEDITGSSSFDAWSGHGEIYVSTADRQTILRIQKHWRVWWMYNEARLRRVLRQP